MKKSELSDLSQSQNLQPHKTQRQRPMSQPPVTWVSFVP